MESFEFIEFKNFDIIKKYKHNFDLNNKDNKIYIVIDNLEDKELKELKEVFKIDEKIERFIKFNLITWYNDIEKTFGSSKDIWRQFVADSNRSAIYCNGNLIETPFKLMEYFDFKNTENIEKILMTCTQATLGFAFEVIHYDLNNRDNFHLSEIPYQDKEDDSNLLINFNINKDEIKFIIEKNLRIFKLIDGDDHTISIVTILIEFNVDDEFGLLNIMYTPV